MTLPVQSCGYIHRSALYTTTMAADFVHDGHLLLHIFQVALMHLVRDISLDSYLV